MGTVYRSCTLCEAICGLEIKVEDGVIKGIRGDSADVFSHGHICPKGPELKAIHEDPDRLKFPLKRVGDQWEQIAWETAFSEIAARLHVIQTASGQDSVAYYAGNPNVHNYGSLLFAPRLMKAIKTRNIYSATSVDQLPHHFAALKMFGHPLLVPVPDVDRTDYFLILGANPMASNGSMMTAPDMRGRMKGIQKRGGKIVVVDPRKTETADLADEHVFVRPGKDVYFLLSILHVVLGGEKKKASRLESIFQGADFVRSMVQDYSPEKTQAHTGISAETTRRIATQFAQAKSAVAYGRIGVSTQTFGGLCHWLINVLNAVTGNLDEPGGAMFSLPAVDTIAAEGKRESFGSFDSYRSKARNLPEFGGELPVSALADEILFQGEGGVRALITSAGNPVLSTPNGGKLGHALESLQLMVSIDIYLNETTKYAHYILPPTSPLEHDHYDIVFNMLAVRNTARYSPPVFDPPAGTMHDWEIFTALTGAIEEARSGGAKKASSARAKIKPTDFLDRMLKSGPYGSNGLNFQKLVENPHGIDFGPLVPVLPGRLKTKDGQIDLAPDLMRRDIERAREAMKETPAGMILIGRRNLRDNNSWMHNVPRLMNGSPRCTLFIHPEDAAKFGISDGHEAIVRSRVGEIRLPVEIVEEIMPGVVSIPHGYGHKKSGTKMSTAHKHPGVSINDLTDDSSLDELTGNAAFNGVPVEISAPSVS